MSFVSALREKWREYAGPEDERIESEMNRIYKVGFLMLSFGWLVLLYYKMLLNQVMAIEEIETAGVTTTTFNFFDIMWWGWLLLTCVVLAVMQVRGGFVSTGRFGETETFPAGYFALISAFAGAGVLVGVTVLRVLANIQVTGAADGIIWLAGAMQGGFTGAVVFILCWGTFYLTFRAAKKRRIQLDRELDED